MQHLDNKQALRREIKSLRSENRSIGFVPTMGFLHQGHLSLMQQARRENDIVVVSVFVNPTQFGPNEDFEAYPRDTQRDLQLMREQGVDIAFFPQNEELYGTGYATYVQVEGPMTETLCGRSRPTHFRGVTTIVAKLFHLVAPDRAYFGQKDAQQVAVIDKMIRDLDFDIQLVVCPIVREADGLALSSRNSYLTPGQRRQARLLSQSLFEAKAMIEAGERRAGIVAHHIRQRLAQLEQARVDYVSVVDAVRLQPVDTLAGDILIALAVKLGKTRLIDNVRIEV